MSARAGRSNDLWFYSILAIAVLAIYSPVLHFDFISLDDPDYINNAHVIHGLSAEGFVWAFTTGYAANWFPVTWLSHMLDRQLFGSQSGLHHLTNLLLHAAATLLLFALLKRITGARWRSAFVAFVFGLHPLHIESVAWVAERKDVLSALFWILTLWTYVNYVERPGISRYLVVMVTFSFGLMSKPMLVTLPFVLLLVDFWPLRRNKTIQQLIVEKIPLFGLAAASSFVTYLVQQSGGSVLSFAQIPFKYRIQNSLISYVVYILNLLWPANLAIDYPYSIDFQNWQTGGAAALLLLLTVLALLAAHRRPYVTVGWLWYLGTLVPVIGLIQVGIQARADRYTHIPMVGISIVLAWGAAEVIGRWPAIRPVMIAGIACSALAWTTVTWLDLRYWRNSISLFERAVDVTVDNYIAQNALGEALLDAGRVDEAVPHFLETLRVRPNSVRARVDLASILSKRNQMAEAETQYRIALQIDPEDPEAHHGLGVVLAEKGDVEEALAHLTKAIQLQPDNADSHYNLGRLYGLQGRADEAIAEFSETVRLQPGNPEAHFNLGNSFIQKDRINDSIREFEVAIRIRPQYVNARFNLGSALASIGKFDEAASQFSEILRLKPDFPGARESLENCLKLRNGSAK
jgi:protein O-mannosyl-transferase